MKVHIPRYARKNEKAHNDHFAAAMWRDLHVNNLWVSFVQSLKTVKYNHGDAVDIKKVWVKEDGTACCKYHGRTGGKGKEAKQQQHQPSQQELESIIAPALPMIKEATVHNDRMEDAV
jgi:hypothetical protein